MPGRRVWSLEPRARAPRWTTRRAAAPRDGSRDRAVSARVRGALLAAGAFLGGAVIAAPFAGPELARRHLRSVLSERSGLGAELDAVSLGWGEAELRGVRLRGRRANLDIEANLDGVRVAFDPMAVASGLLAAVDQIDIAGGTLSLTTTAGALRGEGAESETPRSSSSLPPLSLEDVSLTLADAEGVLVRAERISAHYDAREMSGTASSIRIEGGPTWSLAEAHVALVRAEGRWALRELAARQGELPVRGSETERRGRLRALVDVLRGRSANPDGDDERDDGTGGRGLAARLASDFSATLTGIAIAVAPGAESEDLATLPVGVRALTASVERRGESFVTEGDATPEEGGRIAWDLEVEPEALLASGEIELDAISVAVLAPLLPELPFDAPERASVSGALRLERAGLDEVRGSGSLEVQGLGFSHPRLAASPVRGIDLGLRGAAAWTPATRTLSVEELFVRAPSPSGGGVEVRLDGSVTWQPERYACELHARLPSTRCDDAVHAIPTDVLGELAAMRLEGRIGGALDLTVDSADLAATTLRVQVNDACRFVGVPPFAEPARFAAPFHHRAVENDGDVFEMDTGPGTLAWTPIAAVSPFLLHAVLAHEDASFFRHHGFAPWAIRDALVENLRAGRYVRGASTITMQLVKNAFLHREKTLVRKVQEVLLTWWVETAMTKEQILELYLNVIELGDGVYGIREAARSWFGHEPAELSAAESVYLALILPNPPAFSAEHRLDASPPAAFRRRMAGFLRHLGREGRYDAAAVEAGLGELETLRFASPDESPREPRTPVGSCAPLPIEGLEGPLAEGPSTAYEAEAGDDDAASEEASWDRWEEVVP